MDRKQDNNSYQKSNINWYIPTYGKPLTNLYK